MTATRLLVAAIVVLSVAALTHCAAPAAQTAVPAETEPGVGTRLYIVGDGVRLRSGPSTSHEIVGLMNRGDPVTVLFGSGAWCALAVEADTVWVHANLVGSQAEAQSR